MKAKEGFVTQKTGEGAIAVPYGTACETYEAMATFNDTAAFLWNLLQTEQTAETMADALVAEYDVSRADALRDAERFSAQLREAGMLEE